MSVTGLLSLCEKMQHIINSGIGRDKCCRVIQYFLLYLLPVLEKAGVHNADLIQRLSSLRKSCSSTRKVLRWGKEFPLLLQIRDRIQAH